MPSGDPQRQWFPEMIEMLRQRWAPELSWDDLALLAARLDAVLQRIRRERNIIPPMMTCSKCGVHGRSRFTSVSVNAMILAAGRFGITSQPVARELSERWQKYRKENNLDLCGKKRDTAFPPMANP